MKHLRRVSLCAVLWPGVALPPAVADPMRPLVTTGAAAAPGAMASPVPATGASAAAPTLRKLLAIRQDSNGERTALFGDRWLRAGERYTSPQGETVVLAVGSNHIELEQDKVRTSHHLLAPLLPPQWPAQPPTKPLTKPAAPAAKTATPAALAGPAAAASQPAAVALRTERPLSP